MECFIVREPDIDLALNSLVLRGDEARHAVRVLRLREGEKLMATTLNGTCYRASMGRSEQVSKTEWVAHCQIEEILPEHNEPDINVQLIQGIPHQQSKLEEIAEKVTEMGIRSIIPITTKRTEKKTFNRERLIRILENGSKQTYRARLPKLSEVMSLEEALAHAKSEGRKIIMLHESASLQDSLASALHEESGNKISLVIGPEGGFEEVEIMLAVHSFGTRIASLGPRRMRAETAAIMAVSLALGMN